MPYLILHQEPTPTKAGGPPPSPAAQWVFAGLESTKAAAAARLQVIGHGDNNPAHWRVFDVACECGVVAATTDEFVLPA